MSYRFFGEESAARRAVQKSERLRLHDVPSQFCREEIATRRAALELFCPEEDALPRAFVRDLPLVLEKCVKLGVINGDVVRKIGREHRSNGIQARCLSLSYISCALKLCEAE